VAVAKLLWGLHALGAVSAIVALVSIDIKVLRGRYAVHPTYFRFAWLGLVVLAVTGFVLVLPNANVLLTEAGFLGKLALAITGTIIAVMIHLSLALRNSVVAENWSPPNKSLILASLACWASVCWLSVSM